MPNCRALRLPTSLPKSASLLLLPVLLVICSSAVADTITVGTTDDANGFPFESSTPTTYQQLYDSSQFSEPITISGLAFASNNNDATGGPETLTLTISLSTTSKTLSNLSTTFTSNEGANNTQVYSGTLTYQPLNNIDDKTDIFDLVFATTPFTYDPAAGNLLMTVNITAISGDTEFGFDATTDPVTSRVFKSGGNGRTMAQADYGLVTQFTVSPASTMAPEPNCAFLFLTGLIAVGPLLLATRARLRKMQFC